MERETVSSSNIASIGYDTQNATLEVEFKSRGVYQYFNVPVSAFEGLMSAQSHGAYFNKYVRDNYSNRQIH
jgi:hypothetical protein